MKRLSNEPRGVDMLNGGAQFRLAQRIAEEIREPSGFVDGVGRESGHSVVLAIEGRWGSGKSNVIRMAEDMVGQVKGAGTAKKRVVFVDYDLWAHRQELTRKSILEAVVAKLTGGECPCLQHCFKSDLYALTGTTENGRVRTLELFSWMPVIAVVFFSALMISRMGFASIPWAVASIVASALLGSFLWDWLYLGRGFQGAISHLAMTLRLKPLDVETVVVKHRHDATVEDFICFLHKVSKSLSHPKDGDLPCHLVLVFDNLDRLDKEEIRNFWAAVHVLFAERKQSRPDNVQVLVPYDRARVRDAFGGPDAGDEHIRKTIDVVFDMPEPIMVDWAVFLRGRLEAVFKGFAAAEEIEQTIRVFNWLHVPQDLTPRAIISFVNDLATAYDGMCEIETSPSYHVGLEFVALYVLGWRRTDKLGTNRELSILEGSFIPSKAQVARKWYMSDEDHAVALASVVYQLPEEAAADILAYHRVGKALRTGDASALRLQSEGAAFHTIFASAIRQVNELDSVPAALSGLEMESAQWFWNEYYAVKRDEIVSSHGLIPVLKPSEELLIARIADWKDFYQRIFQHLMQQKSVVFNASIQAQFAASVEGALKPAGRTLAGAFARLPMEPHDYLEMLNAAAGRFPLMNRTCAYARLDDCARKLVLQGDTKCIGLKHLPPEELQHLPKTRAALLSIAEDSRHPYCASGIIEELRHAFRA